MFVTRSAVLRGAASWTQKEPTKTWLPLVACSTKTWKEPAYYVTSDPFRDQPDPHGADTETLSCAADCKSGPRETVAHRGLFKSQFVQSGCHAARPEKKHGCSVPFRFCVPRLPVIAMREVQRATLLSNGNAKSSMTIFDALPIPVHPTTFTIPTFTSEASNGDAKELVVRRMIDSSNHGRISGHQISVRFFVQHLLVSTTEARVTPWRVCKKEKKNDLDSSIFAK